MEPPKITDLHRNRFTESSGLAEQIWSWLSWGASLVNKCQQDIVKKEMSVGKVPL